MLAYLTRNYNGSPEQLRSIVRQKLEGGDPASFVVIVPTNRKVRELQRSLLKLAPGGTSPSFQLFTLERFAKLLHRAACPSRYEVSPSIKSILFEDSVRELAAEGDLKYFTLSRRGGTLRIPPGTLQRIVGVITMLKESGVYVGDLREEFEKLERDGQLGGGEREKFSDIVAIASRYEEKLGDRFIDVGGVYKELTQRLTGENAESIFRTTFTKAELLIVNGFDEFSSPELRMLSAVSAIQSLVTLVCFDYFEANAEVFGHLQESYQHLLEMGFDRIRDAEPLVDVPALKPPGDKALGEQLAKNLFQQPAGKLDCRDRMSVIVGKDRGDEVRAIVRTIKQMILDNADQRLDGICVATYQTEAYTPLFRELFAEYGVPVNITDRYSLAQSPPVVGILSLLEILKNNFRRKDVVRTLLCPYFELRSGGRVLDAANLVTISALLKLSFDSRRWMERIENRIRFVKEVLRAPQEEFDEGELEQELQRLATAKADVELLTSLLAPLSKPLTPAEFHLQLHHLLSTLGVSDRILQADEPAHRTGAVERDVRALERFWQVVSELVQVMEFQGLGEKKLPIVEYIDRLRTGVLQARYNVRQRAGYGVLVTTIEETRGIDFDVMFVAGLVDGEFPLSYSPEIFLSKPRQQRQERYHLVENRYLFYQAVRNFSRRLFLSYPERDGELELVPSTFLDALRAIVDVGEEGSHATSADILSHNELLSAYARGEVAPSAMESEAVGRDRQFIDHAREVERSRWLTHERPEYEGTIHAAISPEAREALGKYADRVYSVSQLETYGACPFQFFAQRVLRLESVPELEEGITPLEKGQILHAALFEFFVERREQQLAPLRNVNDADFDRALQRLTEIVQRKLAEIDIEDVFWEFDREGLLGSANVPGLLREFLEYERTRDVQATPRFFEVSFGRSARPAGESDPLLQWEEPVNVGGVSIRGKVDRIEVAGDRFSIIDYKTGSIPKRGMRDLGMSLQLAAYLAAMEYILSQRNKTPMRAAAGVFLELSEAIAEHPWLGPREFEGVFFPESQKKKLENEEMLRQAMGQAANFMRSYVEGIVSGSFPLTTDEKVSEVCHRCAYVTVCRIQNRQWIDRGRQESQSDHNAS
jgi:ATP-dependent helicase/nuclease subunit B